MISASKIILTVPGSMQICSCPIQNPDSGLGMPKFGGCCDIMSVWFFFSKTYVRMVLDWKMRQTAWRRPGELRVERAAGLGPGEVSEAGAVHLGELGAGVEMTPCRPPGERNNLGASSGRGPRAPWSPVNYGILRKRSQKGQSRFHFRFHIFFTDFLSIFFEPSSFPFNPINR